MIRKLFQTIFNSEPVITRAPGCIYLMGEQVDYYDGMALSIAVDKYSYVAISRRTDGEIHWFDKQANEYCSIKVEELKQVKKDATGIVFSVLLELIKRGYSLNGFNIVLDNEIPAQCGLSSKMAQTVAVTAAFNELFQLCLSRFGIMVVCQAVQESITGEDFGIMQAYPHVFGKRNQAIKMNYLSSEYKFSAFNLQEYKVLLLNTGYYNQPVSKSYAEKREKTNKGLRKIRKYYPAMKGITELAGEHLSCLHESSLRQQAEYFIEEFKLLDVAVESLNSGDIESFGALMAEAQQHFNQHNNTGATISNWLINEIRSKLGVIGVRLQAGVYGGSVIAICKEEYVQALVEQVSGSYKQYTSCFLKTTVLEAVSGVELVNKSVVASIN